MGKCVFMSTSFKGYWHIGSLVTKAICQYLHNQKKTTSYGSCIQINPTPSKMTNWIIRSIPMIRFPYQRNEKRISWQCIPNVFQKLKPAIWFFEKKFCLEYIDIFHSSLFFFSSSNSPKEYTLGEGFPTRQSGINTCKGTQSVAVPHTNLRVYSFLSLLVSYSGKIMLPSSLLGLTFIQRDL